MILPNTPIIVLPGLSLQLFRNFFDCALWRNDQQIGLFDGLRFGLNRHVNLVSHVYIVHKLNGGRQWCWIDHRIKTVR